MLFKNILKFSSLLLLASASYASEEFTGECKEINDILKKDAENHLKDKDEILYNPVIECKTNSKGKVTELLINNKRNDIDAIEKALNRSTITKLEYIISNGFDEITVPYNEFPSVITQLPNLEELDLTYSYFEDAYSVEKKISADLLKFSSNKLKTLTLGNIEITDDIYTQLTKISSLKNLNIYTSDNANTSNFEKLKKLKDITVTIDSNQLSEYTGQCKEIEEILIEDIRKTKYSNENVYSFKPLEECKTNRVGDVIEMNIFSQYNTKEALERALSYDTVMKLTYFINNDFARYANYDEFPTKISKLSSLEDLTLKYHFFQRMGNDGKMEKEVDKDLLKFSSKYLKNLTLDHIVISDNVISQLDKIGTLENLTIISGKDNGDYNYKMAQKLKNIPNITVDGKTVKASDDNNTNDNISKDGKCGKDHGKCPAGECCSKYGYCGRSNDHCYNGCQSEFGDCKSTTTSTKKTTTTTTTTKKSQPTSTDGKCGKDHGSCPSGECCSKYGYCGRSDNHCSVDRGCQSEFGDCKSGKTTTTSTKKTTTTSTKKSQPTSTDGKCGKDHGKCPSGECCSKYGYCGRSNDHCSVDRGCQSEFGDCKSKKSTSTKKTTTTSTKKSQPTSTDGKCGKDHGKCPSGQCCSKYGYCGKNDAYCGSGCQSEFGKCN